jgi:hypothetical protein
MRACAVRFEVQHVCTLMGFLDVPKTEASGTPLSSVDTKGSKDDEK